MSIEKKHYGSPFVVLFPMPESDVIRTSGERDGVIELGEITFDSFK